MPLTAELPPTHLPTITSVVLPFRPGLGSDLYVNIRLGFIPPPEPPVRMAVSLSTGNRNGELINQSHGRRTTGRPWEAYPGYHTRSPAQRLDTIVSVAFQSTLARTRRRTIGILRETITDSQSGRATTNDDIVVRLSNVFLALEYGRIPRWRGIGRGKLCR
jgi:hypothetical protein